MDVLRRNLVAGLGAGGLAMWATPLQARIGFGAGAKGFAIARGGQIAPIMVDPGDFPGVLRAALDLSRDIGRVSGFDAAILKPGDGPSRPPILVGALGRSPLINRLVKDGKLDVGAIRGQWEAYTVQTVQHPLPGVAEALVIAGSDRRGAIYDAPGRHTLKIMMIDLTMVIQKIVVRSEALPVSYFGPPALGDAI